MHNFSPEFVLCSWLGLIALGVWRIIATYHNAWWHGYKAGELREQQRNSMRKSGLSEAVIDTMFPHVKR